MKLETATKTNTYELTYLAAGSLTDSELKEIQSAVEGLVKKHHGKILTEEVWGKKPLAYTIQKGSTRHTEANFVQLSLEFPSEEAPAFERDVYLNNDLIRHLFVTAGQKTKEEVVAE